MRRKSVTNIIRRFQGLLKIPNIKNEKLELGFTLVVFSLNMMGHRVSWSYNCAFLRLEPIGRRRTCTIYSAFLSASAIDQQHNHLHLILGSVNWCNVRVLVILNRIQTRFGFDCKSCGDGFGNRKTYKSTTPFFNFLFLKILENLSSKLKK
ncbi:hypothetical protein L1887_26678 [Cichorium endivia]|nr:hypothetical protein L1887_26678 [Cichorium endivia]